jgi:protein TonB
VTRLALVVVGALLVNLVLYVVMETMISRDRQRVIEGFDAHTIDFVRTSIDEETRTRDRRRTPPPKPQEIKRPRAEVEDIATRAQALPTDMQSYAVSSLLGEGAGVALGQRLVEGSGAVMETMMASDLTPISQLPPEYPMSARDRGIEGWVDLAFVVTEEGFVVDAEVLDASPAGIFERSARTAVLRWRFRPHMRGGRPVAARARYRINFGLAEQ